MFRFVFSESTPDVYSDELHKCETLFERATSFGHSIFLEQMVRYIFHSFVVVSMAFVVAVQPACAQQLAGRRPNIILVMTDDQGMGDLSCMGNEVLRTPHIDALHAKATRFTDFQVCPTCSPTRAAILGGRHEFRSGVTHTINERERMSLDTTTFPQLLQQAGYHTGIFGKWHLGDENAYQPYNRGFEEVFIHGAGGIGQSYNCSCADFPPNRKNRYFDIVALHNDTIVQTEGFCTDVFFRAAKSWIDKQRQSDQPFFAMITTNAPHGPFIAPDKYRQRYLDFGYDQETAARYGMIENIDENFGAFVSQLAEWKLLENTLLIFMTDNGQGRLAGKLHDRPVELFNAGFGSGKNTVHEGGTHVPAFWYWKGVTAEGVDIPALTAHLDLFPTFCELAGAKIPDTVQTLEGRSLVPLLENRKAKWDDRMLFTHSGRWKQKSDPNLSKFSNCAVRTSRWRMVNNRELYELAADPKETTNVFSKYPEVVAKLQAAYDVWWQENLPLMVNENAELSATQPQVERYEKQLAEQGIPKWEDQ